MTVSCYVIVSWFASCSCKLKCTYHKQQSRCLVDVFSFRKPLNTKKSTSLNEMRQQASDNKGSKAAGVGNTVKSNYKNDDKVL